MKKRKSILELDCKLAKEFFLKNKNYCGIDLPNYFSFSKILERISEELGDRQIQEVSIKNKINTFDDVNYILYTNKDGKLSWRPLQIIHPLVYISLINEITKYENWTLIKKRFECFQKNPNIRCLSIPVRSENKKSDKAQQVLQWWEEVEQEAIVLSLEYNFVFETDIADCYSSIYTHSIAWAIETKEQAKNNQSANLFGNVIDKIIQRSQHQQTNGIPQGSVLMDFIAEIVLGYIDELLTTVLKENNINNYHILRYRDDYRIFVKNNNDGKVILKLLAEVLRPFGLKLNSSKTKSYNDLVIAAIKKDKLAWLQLPNPEINKLDLQKHILLIKQHSLIYPNSGSIITTLNKFKNRLEKIKRNRKRSSLQRSAKQIISIVTDIAYYNTKSIAVCCAIISHVLDVLDDKSQLDIIIKVYKKIASVPNSGFVQIWLQRMLKNKLPCDEINFSEPLCQVVLGNQQTKIWNNLWISDKKIKNILEKESIFDENIFRTLDDIISNDEFDLFAY